MSITDRVSFGLMCIWAVFFPLTRAPSETIKWEGRLRNLDVVSIFINLLSVEIFALRFLQSHSVLSKSGSYRASSFA